MIINVLCVAAGIGLLAFAAEEFVDGAAKIATMLNVSAIVVGVFIIGFGTSAPEILVSGLAAFAGDLDVAVGNVVGSNLANLSLVLGIGAVVIPIAVESETSRREAPLTLGAMALFALLVRDGLTRIEGAIMLVAMAVALGLIMVFNTAPETQSVGTHNTGDSEGDNEGQHNESEDNNDSDVESNVAPNLGSISTVERKKQLRNQGIRTVLGLIGTVAGAQLLLVGALGIAGRVGLDGGFVGVTLVAMGTSLPELVTVLQSARKGSTDLILGNLLGSSIFNALAVGGIAALVGPARLPNDRLVTFAPLAAVFVCATVIAMMVTRRTVNRTEGIVLVVMYVFVLPFL